MSMLPQVQVLQQDDKALSNRSCPSTCNLSTVPMQIHYPRRLSSNPNLSLHEGVIYWVATTVLELVRC